MVFLSLPVPSPDIHPASSSANPGPLLQESDFQVKADGTNKYVFNTEAHPVKIAPT